MWTFGSQASYFAAVPNVSRGGGIRGEDLDSRRPQNILETACSLYWWLHIILRPTLVGTCNQKRKQVAACCPPITPVDMKRAGAQQINIRGMSSQTYSLLVFSVAIFGHLILSVSKQNVTKVQIIDLAKRYQVKRAKARTS